MSVIQKCYFKRVGMLLQCINWSMTYKNHDVIFLTYVGLVKPMLETAIQSEVSYFKKNVEKQEKAQNRAQRVLKPKKIGHKNIRELV